MKKLRTDIFNITMSDKTLRLYDAYFRVSDVPSKNTETGFHSRKIMYSIGRRYNPNKVNDFFNSDDPLKDKITSSLAREFNTTPENIIKSHKKGKLHELLTNGVALVVKKLGIPVMVYKKKASFEIYEYCKTEDIDEMMEMVYGTLIALGKGVKTFDPEKKEHYYYKLRSNIQKFFNLGYNNFT